MYVGMQMRVCVLSGCERMRERVCVSVSECAYL
jgi:hypothetical protein